MHLHRPVTGGADEHKEEQVDEEGVEHCDDGPFRDGLTGILQLSYTQRDSSG